VSEKQYPVSVDGWINCGWNTLKERKEDLYRGVALLIGYQVLLFLISLLPLGIFVTIFIQLSAGVVISVGWLNYCLRIVRGEEVQPGIILEPFNRFAESWGVSIFLSILVTVGLMLLIVPGFYVMVRYGFSLFAVTDEKLPVSDSMKFSEKITGGYGLHLTVFYIIAMVSLYLITLIYLNRGDTLGTLVLVFYHIGVTPVLSLVFASAYDSISCAYRYNNLDRTV
jgi:hypothetical protein